MQKINVPLNEKPYTICIDNGLLNSIPNLLTPYNKGQIWILFTQNNLIQKFGNKIIDDLVKAKFNIQLILLEEKESAKSIKGIENIYSQLIGLGCDRNSTFIALGGGVVGDVTGYIAATYMRGVKYIQIPTSLLAMVDSSIGGKTGINLKEGKNLVGAIWQPQIVLIDPYLIKSLPEREIASAFGEIIKYGAILDRKLLELITNNIDDLIKLKNLNLLLNVITRCAKLKSEIISKDEMELGLRKILNFGHTVGHALETYFGFDIIRHGEAISYGMLVSGKLSLSYSNFSNADYLFLKKIIYKLPLPELPDFEISEIIKIMKNDKKMKSGKLDFILLEAIGTPVIKDNVSFKSINLAMEGI